MGRTIVDMDINGVNAIVDTGDVAFSFETSSEDPRGISKERGSSQELNWTSRENLLGEFVLFPYGSSNNLPKIFRDVIQNNHMMPGILKRTFGMIWGMGPRLFQEEYSDNGKITRKWTHDPEVLQWLESWDFQEYLIKCLVDFNHMETCVTKFVRTRGARIGLGARVAHLEHISINYARQGKRAGSSSSTPTIALVRTKNSLTVDVGPIYSVYPLIDPSKPLDMPNALMFSNMYSFCSDYYTVPDLYGALEWIKRSSAIPLILKALSENSMNLKYHIISPNEFWVQKENELKEKCKQQNKKYKHKMLVDFKKKYLKKISEVLSGYENTGKFWHSVKFTEIDGMKIFEHGWEIKTIDQKMKSFIDAQVKVSDTANKVLAGAAGMHPALGGVSESSRDGSGGQQLYALKNFLASGVNVQETIVLKAINLAIKTNWPDKDLKLGFCRSQVEAEKDVSPNKRMKEQV